MTNGTIESVTAAIRQRSMQSRQDYLDQMILTRGQIPPRKTLSCGNLAHSYAACSAHEKSVLAGMASANLGIVTSFNDMLSAHQPLQSYPDIIKKIALSHHCSAQVAGGVPAMCDGVTQGQPGMELSLFSRDVIAMATAVSLSHNTFDGVLCLGVCDKIVPGMLIGALKFGHLPTGFMPAGPMASGIPNKQKATVRQQYAQGLVDRSALLAVESASYHSHGTCNFYGTANSNQVMVEMLGIQLPGASFVNPDDPLRLALTQETVRRVLLACDEKSGLRPLAAMVTEASLVNAAVALLATGGSTNHTLHLLAIAKSAGIEMRWDDLDQLSAVVPLLARIYPNGEADVNAFQQAGGMAFLVKELRLSGLLNEDVVTLMGEGMEAYQKEPMLASDGTLEWNETEPDSLLPDVLRPVSHAFASEGGLRVLHGNLGESIVKTSSVKPELRQITAACEVFDSQEQLQQAFDRGELAKDFIAVIRFQGPKANGMPELHQLTPCLGSLMDQGYNVALVTDGRMSGASGKVPAAIHLCPEALDNGAIARLRSGDVITMDMVNGELSVNLSDEELAARPPAQLSDRDRLLAGSLGRELFAVFRNSVGAANRGASVF
ncbi:MAG: phosphogluconate dehydratase [Pseudohongiella sp.]|nr:phosphogluconate dehydratase [Pseudohongiella sp.]